MMEGNNLDNEEWLSLFQKSMSDRDNPTLREHFMMCLMKSDDNLNDFNLVELINQFIKNKINSGQDISQRYQLL